VRLPALSLLRRPLIELGAEQPAPEVPGPLRLIGGELDEGDLWVGHAQKIAANCVP
jgi:hypothetical protein